MSKKDFPQSEKKILLIKDKVDRFAESIIDTVHEPLIVLDQDLRVVRVSRSFYDFFKVKPEETVGRLIYDLGNKQWDIPRLRELLESILPQMTTFDDFEVDHNFTTIGRRVMLLNARQIQRELGKERIILLAIQDITERKWSEDANIRRMALVVRDSNDAITIQDFEGRITAWNRGAELMYGYSEEEALQKNIWLLTPPDREEEQKDFTLRLIAGEAITSLETQRITKDGRILDIWMTVTKLVDDTGKPIGIASTERDITARKRKEEKIQQLNEQLIQKTSELEQIVYVSSHDLRSPLVNAQGFSKELGYSIKEVEDLLKTDGIPDAIKNKLRKVLADDIPEALHYIQSSVAKMDSLLDGLLKISRIGRVELTLENVDTNSFIKEIAGTFEYQFVNKGISFSFSDLPACCGDKVRISQVFSNIIDNAVKYTDPKRPGTIHISGKSEKDHALFCVEDNGIGIAKEHRGKIFEIFHRLNPADTSGEGLGLAIVQRIMLKHNGKVWVESELGKGSRFFISLPSGI
jgi:PAS domain S-box-containing protein